MKNDIAKWFFFSLIFLIIIVIIIAINVGDARKKRKEVDVFNSEYEEYNRDGLNGLDVTTIINRAVSHNDKMFVEKDEKGYYIDDENRIEIYIVFNGTPYEMEKVNKVGIESFISNFGSAGFNCVDVKYHDSGKISSMSFEAVNY